jgi:hypothetical protein
MMKPAWRKLLDTILADPQKAMDDVRRYVRDVRGGADPIEALHGHVCSAECWHGQAGAVTWPAPKCLKCGSERFAMGSTRDPHRWCVVCGETQRKTAGAVTWPSSMCRDCGSRDFTLSPIDDGRRYCDRCGELQSKTRGGR